MGTSPFLKHLLGGSLFISLSKKKKKKKKKIP